jgi:hypothetical protein
MERDGESTAAGGEEDMMIVACYVLLFKSSSFALLIKLFDFYEMVYKGLWMMMYVL